MKEIQNNLTFIEDLGMQFLTENSKQKKRIGLYSCKCGNIVKKQIANVKNNTTKSCGCEKFIIHGMAKTKIYKVWDSMRQRCTNPKSSHYAGYGAMGITVCDEWLKDFVPFYSWALENGFKEGLSIDRIDNSKGYNPDNCRWTTPLVQSRNQRRLRSTNKSGYKGVCFRKDINKWTATITVDNKQIRLGVYKCRLAAAYAYDEYVINNNLEHTKNFEN